MKKASPESVANIHSELEEWEQEMERLQNLRPVQASRDRLKTTEIPELEANIKAEEAKIPAISAAAEEVSILVPLSVYRVILTLFFVTPFPS